MKKIIFLLTVSFLLIFFSCNKNSIGPSANQEKEESSNSTITIPFNYVIKDGRLVFKTLNDYENAINYLVFLEGEGKLDLWNQKTKFFFSVLFD